MTLDGSGGTEVPVVWRGRRVRAFVPTLLAERDLTLSPKTVERTATARAEVELAASDMPEDYEPLARLLLHAEGVASSFIEGVRAPLAEIVLAEASAVGSHTPAAWVAANLAAVTDAVAAPHDQPLTVQRLCRWHRTLMTGSPMPARHVGLVRDEQGWIGGTSPLDAALVTPPPDRLGDLLHDLVAHVNRGALDPVAQAAVAHAQFEVIHPFADGNGRVGRVLVSWVLASRLQLVTPPPVSSMLATDPGGYLSGLTTFRLGQHEPWVRWFADVVGDAGQGQRSLVRQVGQLRQRWQGQLGASDGRTLRRDALAWTVLEILPRHLVLTAALVAERTGRSPRAARTALQALVRAGVLQQYLPESLRGRGRPATLYISPALLALAGSSPTR